MQAHIVKLFYLLRDIVWECIYLYRHGSSKRLKCTLIKCNGRKRYRIIQIYANELWLETLAWAAVTEREMRLTSCALIKCTDCRLEFNLYCMLHYFIQFSVTQPLKLKKAKNISISIKANIPNYITQSSEHKWTLIVAYGWFFYFHATKQNRF